MAGKRPRGDAEEKAKAKRGWAHWLCEIDDAMDFHFGSWYRLFIRKRD